MNYETLLAEADSHGLVVKEKNLVSSDGRIKGNKIAIRKDINTTSEKSCVLAEELGHYFTSSGNILDMQDVQNRKQEHRARVWGYNRQVGLIGIVKSFESGAKNLYEMSEFLDVPEEYLKECINYYRSRYGEFAKTDNYIIYFTPSLTVVKMIKQII